MANGIFKQPYYYEITANTDITSLKSEGLVIHVKNTDSSDHTITYNTSDTATLDAGHTGVWTYINSAWTYKGSSNSDGYIVFSGGLKNSGSSVYPIDVITNGTYNALDTDMKTTIRADTSSGNVTINGLTNGTYGQILYIFKTLTSNTVTISNFSGSATDQKIYTSDGSDLVLSTRGGITLICAGSNWFEVGH